MTANDFRLDEQRASHLVREASRCLRSQRNTVLRLHKLHELFGQQRSSMLNNFKILFLEHDYSQSLLQIHFMRLIERFQEIPWEFEVTIVQSLSAIADYSGIATDLIHIDLFSALCSPFGVNITKITLRDFIL